MSLTASPIAAKESSPVTRSVTHFDVHRVQGKRAVTSTAQLREAQRPQPRVAAGGPPPVIPTGIGAEFDDADDRNDGVWQFNDPRRAAAQHANSMRRVEAWLKRGARGGDL